MTREEFKKDLEEDVIEIAKKVDWFMEEIEKFLSRPYWGEFPHEEIDMIGDELMDKNEDFRKASDIMESYYEFLENNG